MASLSMAIAPSVRSRPTVSLMYLYGLRAAYLLLVVALGSAVWPAIFSRASWGPTLCPATGIGTSLLAALSLLSLFGLRYPLTMLPLLFFEITWKAIWLLGVALPIVMSHQPLPADVAETTRDCLPVAVFLLVMPWRYIVRTYVLHPGDRWR